MGGGHVHPYAFCPMPGPCLLCRPPETQLVVRNRTVRACCAGWSGPHCTEGRGWGMHWGAPW